MREVIDILAEGKPEERRKGEKPEGQRKVEKPEKDSGKWNAKQLRDGLYFSEYFLATEVQWEVASGLFRAPFPWVAALPSGRTVFFVLLRTVQYLL